MRKIDLHEILRGPWDEDTRPKGLFDRHVSADPAKFVDAISSGLSSDEKRIQNGCSELASLLSEKHPELLYPHLDEFLANLGAREPVLRWEAACTLGNLAAVDSQRKVPHAIEKLEGFLADKSIVLQGHAVRALGKIARAFPETAPGVLEALTASTSRFPGTRVGYLVEAMECFGGDEKLAARARDFLAPYLASELRPVATKAKKALKKLGGVAGPSGAPRAGAASRTPSRRA